MDKWMEKEKMLPVTVYANLTGQYTDEEIEEMENSYDLYSEVVVIPVPEDLLWQWYRECEEFDRDPAFNEEPEGGWGESTKEDMLDWLYNKSTFDDTYTLCDWLTAHNYNWKRLN